MTVETEARLAERVPVRQRRSSPERRGDAHAAGRRPQSPQRSVGAATRPCDGWRRRRKHDQRRDRPPHRDDDGARGWHREREDDLASARPSRERRRGSAGEPERPHEHDTASPLPAPAATRFAGSSVRSAPRATSARCSVTPPVTARSEIQARIAGSRTVKRRRRPPPKRAVTSGVAPTASATIAPSVSAAGAARGHLRRAHGGLAGAGRHAREERQERPAGRDAHHAFGQSRRDDTRESDDPRAGDHHRDQVTSACGSQSEALPPRVRRPGLGASRASRRPRSHEAASLVRGRRSSRRHNRARRHGARRRCSRQTCTRAGGRDLTAEPQGIASATTSGPTATPIAPRA